MRYMYIMLNNLLGGVSAPILKKMGELVPIYPIIAIRGILSIIMLGVVHKRGKWKPLTFSDKVRYVTMILLSTVGFYTYYTALGRVDVGFLVLMTVNLTTLLTLVASSIFLKERFCKMQWGLIILSLIILAMFTVSKVETVSAFGVVLLLINCVANTIISLIMKGLLDARQGSEVSVVRTGVDVFLSCVMLALSPALLLEFMDKTTTLICLLILYLGVNSTLLSLLSNKSIEKIGVAMTDILRNMTTVVTIIVGVLFFGERYTVYEVCLMGIFVTLLFILMYVRNSDSLVEPPHEKANQGV